MDGLEINFMYISRYFETVHFWQGRCYSIDIFWLARKRKNATWQLNTERLYFAKQQCTSSVQITLCNLTQMQTLKRKNIACYYFYTSLCFIKIIKITVVLKQTYMDTLRNWVIGSLLKRFPKRLLETESKTSFSHSEINNQKRSKLVEIS